MTWIIQTYSLPLARPYKWAKGQQTERRGLLMSFDGVAPDPDDDRYGTRFDPARDRAGAATQAREIPTNTDGPGPWAEPIAVPTILRGWGETAPPPHDQATPAIALQAHQLTAQFDARQPEASLDAAQAPARIRHGLLCAWLDLQARLADAPLNQFLAERYAIGRTPTSVVPVNALIEAVAPQEAADLADAAIARGFRTLKVKSDGIPANDIARLDAIRAAVGNHIPLRLDANESWRPEEAPAHLERLASYNLAYVEQPLRAGRFKDLVELCKKSPVPIALDESATDWAAIQAYIDHGAGATLILKPQRLGGPDRTLDMITRAHDHGLTCVVTNSLETAVGRAHALHIASLLPPPLLDCGLATETFLAQDVAQGPIPQEGELRVPTGPGLGIGPILEEARVAADPA